MKHLITAFVAIACIVAGGVAGHFLKSSSGGGSAPATELAGEDGASGHEPEKAKSEAGGHGSAPASKGGSSGSSYYRFSREFVVPLIENGRVASLVILNISLEVDSAISGSLFSKEPALRDNIMTTLIALSNDGRTFESITNVENYESLRAMVLMNLKKVQPTGINNVLILDMARQDV
ncbi:flagellar basal body-associated FliL family protein [Hyphomonas sp.]|uniref:flagellar basal body-associated FliL family protein n=1 Tax=Hyphomonas sp. TaxID=87 RepID=UPI00391DA0BD